MRKSFKSLPALFAPVEMLEHPAKKALDGIEGLVDWDEMEALLPRGEGKVHTGRPGYPALMLYRALLLGQLYRLSDVQLSNQLMRDLLFRRFCRIELDQGVPDVEQLARHWSERQWRGTLGRFRAALDGRMKALLALVNRALAERNLILTEGQIAIVDASVVEASQSRLKKGDPEAGSAVKYDVKGRVRAVWGWKGFVNVDEENFVQALDFAPGNVAEVRHLNQLMLGTEARLYADAAYIGPTTRALLAAGQEGRGTEDHVQRRNSHSRKLTPDAVARNEGIGVIRAGVERYFAHCKRVWGMGRTSLKGLSRNRVWWTLRRHLEPHACRPPAPNLRLKGPRAVARPPPDLQHPPAPTAWARNGLHTHGQIAENSKKQQFRQPLLEGFRLR
jgi:IS5 family transposase